MTGLRVAEAQRDPFICRECKQSRLKKGVTCQSARWEVSQGDTGMLVPQDKMYPSKLRLPQWRGTLWWASLLSGWAQKRCSNSTCRLLLQLYRKDTASCYYHPYPPPIQLSGVHSSPITSSNDSNLSPCACGLSKNGRHMWKKSEAVAEIQRRGMSAPRAIRKHANAAQLGLGEVGWAGIICSLAQIHGVHIAIIQPCYLTEHVHWDVCAGGSGVLLWNHHSGSPCGVDLPPGGGWSSGGVAPIEV